MRLQHYTEDGWYTIDGYCYEADKLSRCVQWARRNYFVNEFTFFASINFTEDLTADEMKALWSKVCRHLSSKGVIALYTCEISRRSNHFNYHLLLRSHTPNLTEHLKFATKSVKTNIKVEAYNPGRGRFAIRYMTKAKTPKYKNGELVSRDRWANKRVLLLQKLKMRKYGTIGDFWQGMNKETIWNEIKAHERKINEGLQHPGAEEYARELHELIQGYFPLNRVRRSVGYFGVPHDWVPEHDHDVVDDHDGDVGDHHDEEIIGDHSVVSAEKPASAATASSTVGTSPPMPRRSHRMPTEALEGLGAWNGLLERAEGFLTPLFDEREQPHPTARPPPDQQG